MPSASLPRLVTTMGTPEIARGAPEHQEARGTRTTVSEHPHDVEQIQALLDLVEDDERPRNARARAALNEANQVAWALDVEEGGRLRERSRASVLLPICGALTKRHDRELAQTPCELLKVPRTRTVGLGTKHSVAGLMLGDTFAASIPNYLRKWRRRESNPATSMIWARNQGGISHKSAIRRGRWVARVRYLAWQPPSRGQRGPTGPWLSSEDLGTAPHSEA